MKSHMTLCKTILCIAPTLVSLGSVAHAVEIEGNAAVASNYMWRGMTQTDDEAAVSGGLDITSESGLYAGTWVSNVKFIDSDTGEDLAASYELDLYAGFAGEAGALSYDVGYIAYMYPDAGAQDYDFGEAYVSIGLGAASLTYSYQISDSADSYANDTNYLSADYEMGLPDDFSATFHYGYYDIEDADEQTDYSLTLSKADFSLAFIGTEDVTADDDMKVVLSYSMSF